MAIRARVVLLVSWYCPNGQDYLATRLTSGEVAREKRNNRRGAPHEMGTLFPPCFSELSESWWRQELMSYGNRFASVERGTTTGPHETGTLSHGHQCSGVRGALGELVTARTARTTWQHV